jgi:N-acylneuraminate cytidylyltransferase
MKKIVFFLPTRKGSERVLSKNTRQFADFEGGILELKLKQLIRLNLNIPIIISTNDEESIRVCEKFSNELINVIVRPDYLCKSSTNINDFINYIPDIIPHDKHVFWIHTTAPFVEDDTYKKVISNYQKLDGKYDSIISVNKIQQFLWDPVTNKCINHDRSITKWPRTQDLKILYEINHAFYVNSIRNYIKYKDRIGENPMYFELDKLESFDIDWEDDFIIAEKIYKSIK